MLVLYSQAPLSLSHCHHAWFALVGQSKTSSELESRRALAFFFPFPDPQRQLSPFFLFIIWRFQPADIMSNVTLPRSPRSPPAARYVSQESSSQYYDGKEGTVGRRMGKHHHHSRERKCEKSSASLFAWLIDRLLDWRIDPLIDWLFDGSIDWLIDWKSKCVKLQTEKKLFKIVGELIDFLPQDIWIKHCQKKRMASSCGGSVLWSRSPLYGKCYGRMDRGGALNKAVCFFLL